MKQTLYILLFLVQLCSYAQNKQAPAPEKIKISKRVTVEVGGFYLDSVKIDMDKTLLDPDNIREVRVFKGDDAKTQSGAKGATLITRKSKAKLSSLESIVSAAKAGNANLKDAKEIQVVINGKVVSNIEGYQIEKSAITKTDILIADKKDKVKGSAATISITTKKPGRRK